MKAILFDWDGTLADSIARLYAANVAVFDALGLSFDEAAYRRHYSPDWRLMYERLGVPRHRVDEAGDLWLAAYRSGGATVLIDGAAEALDRLHGAGYRLGLVTAGHRELVEPLIAEFGLAGRFEAAVFGGDLPEQKPHPAPLLAAVARLGGVAPADAVYLGDSVEDMAMAVAAGVRAVGIPSPVSTPATLRDAGAAEIAPSVGAWTDALLARVPLG